MVHLYATGGVNNQLKVSHSAEAILSLLVRVGQPLAVKEIKNELPFSERTIHYALRQLREHSLVEKRASLQDLRESHYHLAFRAAMFGYRV
ncbi:MAG: GntR family transcriptional regulator [Candidatus Heimdallarchaeota archaeon]|nr:GntR family transcriptional regulator [Candidatus Heimdallarchaeota archaeon]